ncbi:MAG: hypothetical protein KVP17_001127 [Porospora cf. gigantea B]|uniref:uncharacterized protein n=1 Tax=Porospora cf. gigantea B TaxID=2853592 RepID=UPI003571DCCD|nr:MAG: hypothetical protein KVP17_001127 [Porospora cf. gigantea B]
MSLPELIYVSRYKGLIDAADDTSGTSLAGMGTTYAWTSSEYNSNYAWIQRFSDGSQVNSSKNLEYWVLPARRILI